LLAMPTDTTRLSSCNTAAKRACALTKHAID